MLNLYYAKARMYDAENRRFTSVDPILDASRYDVSEYVTNTAQLVQYLYVQDMPLVAVDLLGLDIIIITQSKAVGRAGHMGAVVPDCNGDWYFFYWGDIVLLEKITDPDALLSRDAFNEYLVDNNLSSRGNDYDETAYIRGDFSATYDHYKANECQQCGI